MVVTALVVSLPGRAEPRARLLERLARDPRVTLGARCADHLPVAALTADAREGVALVEELEAIDDTRVAVIAIDFEDLAQVAS